ncbi:doxx family protein [Pontibacter sp. G13]|uniref:doxx family protein n=1 Tax=Pontibacter sp. G13 TaxID=3074898 RepID=UPI00288B389C|nr:doxx family protein [Pontibacter sp. G13]WNJ18784.1 doxx family protein [Pontibacter sp. G13]
MKSLANTPPSSLAKWLGTIRLHLKKNHFLAISIGLVYLWFGGLKFIPHLSPAEDLARRTTDVLTLGLIPSDVSYFLLALWETLIGACLLLNIYRRPATLLALIHMVCTFAPLIIFPEQSFLEAPLCLTLKGQYIMKNLIIIAALIHVYRLPMKKTI